MRIAAEHDAVIRLHYRPGHFLTQGHPMATVWPPEAAGTIGRRLEAVHITGPLRTLSQDIAFGIDQLVEIAIRALSPAVNDTFTAMTCIDWLGDSLCKIAVEWHPQSCHRDRRGAIRLITVPVSYERLVQRSFEKVRQAADGMPAVLIRQLDALAKVMAVAPQARSQVLLDQAAMIQRVSQRTVPEPADQADITARYEALLALHARSARAEPEPPVRAGSTRPCGGRDRCSSRPCLRSCLENFTSSQPDRLITRLPVAAQPVVPVLTRCVYVIHRNGEMVDTLARILNPADGRERQRGWAQSSAAGRGERLDFSLSAEQGELKAAAAKLFASEAWVASSLDAIQVHGAYGYMKESGIERDLRDAVAGTIYSGTSEIQRVILARMLGL